MFPSRLLMIHDATTCRQDDIPELSRWQQLDDPFLEIRNADVIAGGDDASFVDTAIELDHDLS